MARKKFQWSRDDDVPEGEVHFTERTPRNELRRRKNRINNLGRALVHMKSDQLREMVHQQGLHFRDQAPTSADQAADIILKGVKDKQWRILVGDDAQLLDAFVRESPEDAYEEDFVEKLSDNSVMDRITRGNND